MYYCNNCGEYFEEPTTQTEDYGECHGRHVTREYDACPCCGSDDIAEAVECRICGEPIPPFSTEEFCETCHAELENVLEEAGETLQTDRETLKDLIAEHFGW